MNKARWEKLHDEWEENFAFWRGQISFFKDMAKKNPGDKDWHEIIKGLEKILQQEQKQYKEIYGTRFNINRVRQDRDKIMVFPFSHPDDKT